jgi:hypothetical protein
MEGRREASSLKNYVVWVCLGAGMVTVTGRIRMKSFELLEGGNGYFAL